MENRRSFLKKTALATAAAIVAPAISACAKPSKEGIDQQIAAKLDYRDDGTFTLAQLTDTHFISGDTRSDRALECVRDVVTNVHPDLIIHTGDIVFGEPVLDCFREILSPIVEAGIHFAVALGNHDAEFSATREELYAYIRKMKGCLNLPPKDGVYGCSNDVITLGDDKPERVFYLFDSGNSVAIKTQENQFSYDYIRGSQLNWYRAHSERFTAANGGAPVPSLAFFHIPLREMPEGVAAGGELIGNNCEACCPSRVNSGLLAQFLEMGDVEAIVNGHDHNCDYVLRHGPMFYIYGRYSGGDTVYNDLGMEGVSGTHVSGCRIFQFRKGERGFHTWIRLVGGETQQKLYCHDNTITRE